MVKALEGSDALAPPVDFEMIWTNLGTGQPGEGSDNRVGIWRPIAPEGYTALGFLAVPHRTFLSPDCFSDFRTVRNDLVHSGTVGDYIWRDGGSGAVRCTHLREVGYPTAENFEGMAYIRPGTFIGSTSQNAPTSDPCLYVLNIELPVITDVNDTSYAPELQSHSQPPDSTPAYLGREIAVPFYFVRDTAFSLNWKVTNSPVYRMKMIEYYKNQYFYNNRQGSEAITHTITNTIGVTESTSNTYSQTFGLEISAEAGLSIGGFGGTVSTKVNRQFGYESTSSRNVFIEDTVSRTFTIAAGKSGCLWQKATHFTVYRNRNNWEPVSTQIPVITMDSFVVGQFPPN